MIRDYQRKKNAGWLLALGLCVLPILWQLDTSQPTSVDALGLITSFLTRVGRLRQGHAEVRNVSSFREIRTRSTHAVPPRPNRLLASERPCTHADVV
jgi:hypothetical protein